MKFKETLRFLSGQAGFIQHHKAGAGFTLIELIIVIAIIALLAAATFVAVNPAKRIGDANNAQRWSDVTAIADAYSLYLADNSGTAPSSTIANGVTYTIATTTGGTFSSANCTTVATTTTALVDLSALVTSGYVGQIPTEPTWTYADHNYHTNYYFYTDATGAVKVGACETYNSADIEVIR